MDSLATELLVDEGRQPMSLPQWKRFIVTTSR